MPEEVPHYDAQDMKRRLRTPSFISVGASVGEKQELQPDLKRSNFLQVLREGTTTEIMLFVAPAPIGLLDRNPAHLSTERRQQLNEFDRIMHDMRQRSDIILQHILSQEAKAGKVGRALTAAGRFVANAAIALLTRKPVFNVALEKVALAIIEKKISGLRLKLEAFLYVCEINQANPSVVADPTIDEERKELIGALDAMEQQFGISKQE